MNNPSAKVAPTAATALFKRHFNQPPVHLIRAPGRLELLGNHVDYNEGLVLSLAVDRYIEIAVAPRSDGKIELVSSAFPQSELFWADKLEKNPAAPWADYVKGVLLQLKKTGVHFTGFNAAIDGNIPMGAGMSSSAALEVSTALAIRQLHPFSVTENGFGAVPVRDKKGFLPALTRAEKLQLAKIARAAESEFVGVNVGLLDQISSLFGKAASVMEIDFKTLNVNLEPMSGEAIVICNSGVKHALVEGAYNELRKNCEHAAKALGVRTLREADPQMVEASRAKLSPREYECALHITQEIQRVMFGSKALSADDHEQFGQYMFQSHESSRDFFRNSAPELDQLVEIARRHPACLGARLTGGGFGGATINLVRHHEAPAFMDYMAQEYRAKSGHDMTPILCRIVDGAA